MGNSIQEVLAAVSQSDCLGASDRQYELLKYLLTEAAAGRGDSIKAYAIAVDVLGRGEDFDNTTDSIVRVEMHRLRKNLSIFNKSNADFTIDIPRASYIPIVGGQKDKKAFKPHGGKRIIYLLLATGCFAALFYHVTTRPNETNYLRPRIFVDFSSAKSPERKLLSTFYNHMVESPLGVVTKSPNFDYKLDLSIQDSIVDVHLFDSSGELLWGKKYNHDNVQDDQNAIVNQIMTDTIYAHGVIWPNFAAKNPQSKCFIDFYELMDWGKMKWHNNELELLDCIDIDNLGSNVERSIVHSLRARLYLNNYTNYIPFEIDEPFEKAQQELIAAASYDTKNHEYIGVTIYLETENPHRNTQALNQVLDDALALYPHDEGLLYDAARTSGYILGDWQKALDILSKPEFDVDDRHTRYANIYLSEALSRHDFKTAALYTEKLQPDWPIYDVFKIATYCELEHADQLEKVKARLISHDLNTASKYRKFILSRRYEDNLTTILLQPAKDPVCTIFQ